MDTQTACQDLVAVGRTIFPHGPAGNTSSPFTNEEIAGQLFPKVQAFDDALVVKHSDKPLSQHQLWAPEVVMWREHTAGTRNAFSGKRGGVSARVATHDLIQLAARLV